MATINYAFKCLKIFSLSPVLSRENGKNENQAVVLHKFKIITSGTVNFADTVHAFFAGGAALGHKLLSERYINNFGTVLCSIVSTVIKLRYFANPYNVVPCIAAKSINKRVCKPILSCLVYKHYIRAL